MRVGIHETRHDHMAGCIQRLIIGISGLKLVCRAYRGDFPIQDTHSPVWNDA